MKKIIMIWLWLPLYMYGYAQPANDEPCGAISIPVENTGCEPSIVYSYTNATYSSAIGSPVCIGANVQDVWYKFTVPLNGEALISIALNAAEYSIAVELYKSTSCSALSQVSEAVEGFPCLYTNGYSEPKRTFKNLTPGSTAYLRVYQTFPQNPFPNNGSVKICVSNTNGLADDPCTAGFFQIEDADPLGQTCVPNKIFSWANATLTPAVPNPSCGVITPSNIRDVWFKVKVPSSGKISYQFTNATPETQGYASPFIAVYSATACNGTFTEIACGFYGSELTGLSANSIIYFRVYIYSSSIFDFGSIKLCVAAKNSVPGINNSSKIGIGIDTPFAKLDVVGTGIFRDKLTAGSDVEVRGNLIVQGNIVGKYGTAVLQGNTTIQGGPLKIDSLDLGNRLGNRIALYGGLGNSGKYGFGIQSSLLQLFSDAAVSNIAFGYGNSYNFNERMRIINNGTEGMSLKGRLHLRNGTTDLNNGGGVWLYKADNSNLLGFMGTQNNQNIGFYGGPVNSGWGLVYDAINGRVGIGTSTPTSLLNVNGQITVDQKNFGGYGGLLLKGNVPGSNYPNIGFAIKNNAATPVDVVAALISGDLMNNAAGAETIDLTFQTSQSGQAGIAERMRIKSNGNVGIGTNNPVKPLSFPALLGEKILLYPGGAGEVGIGVYGNELRLHADNPGAKVSFGTQDNAGVFSENALAQRNGVYAFSILGSLWANGTTYASDERFKQNITAIASPLKKLLQLNGVEYEMKTKEFAKNYFTPGRQMGLIAQEVEKIIPEAVNEKDGFKGVDYARLVPLLIEAIKEQDKKIEALKQLVETMNKKN
jgi:hypothetical protein